MLSQSFQEYFQHGEVSVSQGWMQDPFVFNLDSMDDNGEMKEDLVEMKASNKIKMEFDSMQLDTFWCAQLNTFPQLAESTLEILVPFATTYFCETGFSTLVHIKTKDRNRLDASDDMRVAISKKNLVSAWSLMENNNKRAISNMSVGVLCKYGCTWKAIFVFSIFVCIQRFV